MSRTALNALFVLVLLLTPGICGAELQNIEIGGSIEILGSNYMNTYMTPGGARLLIPAAWLTGRSIGVGPGNAPGIFGAFSGDSRDSSAKMITQWTRLHVKADFTSEVSAFIEFDSVDNWGSDFRSNYVTGADARANSIDDIEVYQSFIQTEQTFGQPLRLRIGRQEMTFGSQWLVGDNSFATIPITWGLSFDAIRATYTVNDFTVDAWTSKLAERGVAEEDGDADFHGIYASYTGIENIALDAYWMFLRDAQSLNDTNFTWFPEWLEDAFGLDDYDATAIHTIGLRGAGTLGAFDFEAEGAYQWGDAGQVGFMFKPFLYGDDSAEYNAWAFNAELGYTFQTRFTPRLYLGYSWYGGEDNRSQSFWEWLSPFDRPEASVSFNRLFSDYCHSDILDISDLSNVSVARLGATAALTDCVELQAELTYLRYNDTFDAPVAWRVAGLRIPVAPAFGFWTSSSSPELGWETSLYVTYHYSPDLTMMVGWSHLFSGEGLQDGSFASSNGAFYLGASGEDDADYLFWDCSLAF